MDADAANTPPDGMPYTPPPNAPSALPSDLEITACSHMRSTILTYARLLFLEGREDARNKLEIIISGENEEGEYCAALVRARRHVDVDRGNNILPIEALVKSPMCETRKIALFLLLRFMEKSFLLMDDDTVRKVDPELGDMTVSRECYQ